MDLKRWQKIEDIFQAALDLAPAERQKFIVGQASGDDELQREIEKLVGRFESEEEFLESPVWTDSQFLGNTLKKQVASSLEEEIEPISAGKSFIGKKIGVYRLTEQIGKGGMGVVYGAERADGEFRQKVAVKLIKRGMDSDFIVRRFRRERQVLANLNHPNIAHLFDGGTTADGSPYFIMEFIEGKPFLNYCRENNLDLREKLELFSTVCQAVAYAHFQKIVHRDIKPSNILVTAAGVPKLLDFGIAKILDTDSIHESAVPTATAMRLMTPEYASPEQVRGEQIMPASDQYSLGVLLYELLTGSRPYKFPSRAPHEIARVICEEIPAEPSSGDFGKVITGSNSDFQFADDFCQKLDRIVLKALRKNPAERYVSVEEFAEDIESFLQNEPLKAENFLLETDVGKFAPETGGNGKTTGDIVVSAETEDKIIPAPRKQFSPRAHGVKQGVFAFILSLLLLPVFFILIISHIIPSTITISIFFLLFFGGIIRIIYALMFEPKAIAVENISPQNEISVIEADKEIIESNAPEKPPQIVAKNKKLPAPEKSSPEEKSIAVLPFKNFSTTPELLTGENEFLRVGLADALITRLSGVRQLMVRPTSSILPFVGEDADAFVAGEELNVEYILTGNIARTNVKTRISIQLFDVKKKATVWAERFDEDFTEVLEIEDSVAAKVVESLLPKLTTGEHKLIGKRATNNADAYEAYLRGRFYWNSFTEDSFAKAFASYNEAISKDKNFALAYAGIADYYIWLGVYGIVAPQNCYPPAKEAAERAIEIDLNLAEAYAALGFAQLCGDLDWENAEKNTLRAIEINPHYALARLWYSFILQSAARFDEGIEQAKKAVEFDPLTYMNHHVLGWAYYFSRRFDEAVEQGEKTIRKFPSIGLGEFNLSWFLRFLGRNEAALNASRKALKLSGESLFVLLGHAQALAAAGDKEETEKTLRQIFKYGEQQYLSYYQVALVYAYLGEKQNALDALERAYAESEGWFIWLNVEPALDVLRGEPRFNKLLREVNPPNIKDFSNSAPE